MAVTITRTEHLGTPLLGAYRDGAHVGTWVMPPGGTPYGVAYGPGTTLDTDEYMTWLYAVSGYPKVYLIDVERSLAFFLTAHEEPYLGYANLDIEGRPVFTDDMSGLTADWDVDEDEDAAAAAAEKALTEFVSAVPALVAAANQEG